MSLTVGSVIAGELDREAVSTLRLLQIVPVDRFDWRPHEKSMTLCELAWHVATLPASMTRVIRNRKLDVLQARPSRRGEGDLIEAFHRSLDDAKALIASLDDEALLERFQIVRGEAEVASFPVLGAIRTLMMNHVYHHRGQLTVYLRLLDVPLPAVYGSSADEMP